MNRKLFLPVFLGLFTVAAVGPALAQSDKLWVSPLRAEEEWRTLRPAPVMTITNGSPSTTVLLSTSNTSQPIWVRIPMTIPGNLLIWSVTVCYQSSDPATGILQIQLSEMTDPNSGVTKHAEALFLNSTTPECYESVVAAPRVPFPAQGTLTLGLLVSFADVSHTIEIGGISINHQLITVDAPEGITPGPISLQQNVPNPFAGSTTIEYELPSAGPVELLVFDVAGRRIRTLEQGQKGAGIHQVIWDARDERGVRVAPGVYFYQARTGDRLGSKRMVLAR